MPALRVIFCLGVIVSPLQRMPTTTTMTITTTTDDIVEAYRMRRRRRRRRRKRRIWRKGVGGGAAGNRLQDYLRYGRGHLCRNETSASSAQPNFGNSLYALVDANSYPLVFPAGNLAQPVISWHISAPSVSLSLSFG